MSSLGGLNSPFLLSPEEKELLLNQGSTEICVSFCAFWSKIKLLLKILRDTNSRCVGKM